MSVVMPGLFASVARASDWLAIHQARQARHLRAEAGRLRSELLREIARLEARHRRLQGRLAAAAPSIGPGRAAWDLRPSFSARAQMGLADLRARTEKACAAVATEPDLGLSACCSALSAIAREVAAWAKALSEREALRPRPPVSRLAHFARRVPPPTAHSPRSPAREPRLLGGQSSRA